VCKDVFELGIPMLMKQKLIPTPPNFKSTEEDIKYLESHANGSSDGESYPPLQTARRTMLVHIPAPTPPSTPYF